MSRYQAGLYHLLISFCAFLLLSYMVLFHWFPDFFFAIDGGWEGMRILIGVDLILGPLLTTIVFRSGKPGLKFDLSVIGTVQAACLLAGVYVIYSERPIFFTYYERHFYSISADTFGDYGVQTPDWRDFAEKTPARVYVRLPDNPIEEADVRGILYRDGVPLWAYPRMYAPLSEYMDVVITEGAQESLIRARDPASNLDNWLREQGGSFDDYAFVPIHSRYRDAFLGIRKSTREFVDILEVPPPLNLNSIPRT